MMRSGTVDALRAALAGLVDATPVMLDGGGVLDCVQMGEALPVEAVRRRARCALPAVVP